MEKLNGWIMNDLGDVAHKMAQRQMGPCSMCTSEVAAGRFDMNTRAAVSEALDDILEALFPGCYGREFVDGQDIPLFVGDRLRHAAAVLGRLCEFAFNHRCSIGMCDRGCDCEAQATDTVIDLMEQLPDIHGKLMSDIQAAYEGDPASISINEIVLSYPFVEAIATHRIAHVLYERRVPIIPRIMSERAHSRTGIDIHPGAKIGKRFFIDHGTGVVIGETSEIGDNVRLYQGVTLGAMRFVRDEDGNLVRRIKRHPTIEDDVVIYAGATILGGKTVIGKGSVVGGNVWLTESVPPHSKVLNAPLDLRVITREKTIEERSARHE